MVGQMKCNFWLEICQHLQGLSIQSEGNLHCCLFGWPVIELGTQLYLDEFGLWKRIPVVAW